jgi:hypothetical protein
VTEFKIRRRADTCSVSGRPFLPGDVVVSVITEDGEGFLRRDMHEECFAQEKGEPFCVWRSRQPEPPAPKQALDYDFARTFFDRLVREADPAREALVYALTLLLSRKRRVRIRETRRLPEGELLRVVVPRDEEDDVVSVRAPRLNDEQIDALQAELEGLFDLPSAAPASGASPEAAVGGDPKPEA